MTDFKVGDKVRYVGNKENRSFDPDWIGLEGEINEVSDWGLSMIITNTFNIRNVPYKTGREVYPKAYNLELITEFKYADIQKGDKIKRTVSRGDGTEIVTTGVADRIYRDYQWVSSSGYSIAFESDDSDSGITLELIERPEPPHWAEDKPVGSVFLYGEGADKTVWKKTGLYSWMRTVLTTGHTHNYTIDETKRYVTEDQEWLK